MAFRCPECNRVFKSKQAKDAHYFKLLKFDHDGQHNLLEIRAAPEFLKLCKTTKEAQVRELNDEGTFIRL